MKNIIALVFVVLIMTEIKSQNLEISGGFGCPFITMSFNNNSPSIGGGGAMLFNKNLFFGGFGQGTSSFVSNKSDLTGFQDCEIETERGGLWFGYILRTKNFDYSLSSKIAWGEIKLNDKIAKVTYYDEVFVFTPSLEIEKRFLGILKISLGVFYDVYSDVELMSYHDGNFSGGGISFALKSGVF